MADKKDKKDKKKRVVKQKQKQKQTQKQTVNIHLGAKTVRRSAPKASAQKQVQPAPSFIPIYTPSPASAPTIIYADRTPSVPAPVSVPVAEKPFFTLADVPGDLFGLRMDDSVSQYGKTPKFSEKKTVSKISASEKAPSMVSKPSTYVSSITEPPTYVSSKVSSKAPTYTTGKMEPSVISSITAPPTYVSSKISSKAPTYTTGNMEPSVISSITAPPTYVSSKVSSKAPSTGTYGLGELFYEPSVASSKVSSTGTYGLGELFYEPSVASSKVSSKAPSTGTYGLGELFYEPSVASNVAPSFISEEPTKLTYTTAYETPVPEENVKSKNKGGRPAGSGDPFKQWLINWYVVSKKSEKPLTEEQEKRARTTASKMSVEKLIDAKQKWDNKIQRRGDIVKSYQPDAAQTDIRDYMIQTEPEKPVEKPTVVMGKKVKVKVPKPTQV